MQDKKYNAILDFCQNDFIHWYLSRGRYFNFKQKNILAQFMPDKSPIGRDYANSPLCAYFYLAMELQHDRNQHDYTCFMYVYFGRFKPKSIKEYLHVDLNDSISKSKLYRIAHETAERINSLAIANMRMNEMLNNRGNVFQKSDT